MCRHIEISERREWYSLKEVQEVYRMCRKTLSMVIRDAEDMGLPIRIVKLYFEDSPKISRQRPFVRLERKSLNMYLSAHMKPEDRKPVMELTPRWQQWFSPADVQAIYGFSRQSLWRILKDARINGKEIKVAVMEFMNGSSEGKRNPFIRIERKSLDAYLEAHVVFSDRRERR